MGDLVRFPYYKDIAENRETIDTGSLIMDGSELRLLTERVLEEEGFPLPRYWIEEYITMSFQDAITNMVAYEGIIDSSLRMLERIHGRSWYGKSSWNMDFVYALMDNICKKHPFGIWDVRFQGDDLVITLSGNYGERLFQYLQARNQLPDTNDVLMMGGEATIESTMKQTSAENLLTDLGMGDLHPDDMLGSDPYLAEGMREFLGGRNV